MITLFRRVIAMILIICVAGIGTSLPAHAAMIATDAAASPDRVRIVTLVERADVQQQLAAHGVSTEQVKARVAAMSDAEVGQLASQLDSLPAGGDLGGALITAVLVVFLVLLLTDILGFTKIFPFTKPIR
jgi:cellobiose-specific phosphotransferase system component IIB